MDLRADPIPRLIRQLAVPASIGMMFSVLLNITDTYYAGKLSSTALAALTLSAPVYFLVMTIGIGVGQATNALVGNRLGAGETGEARRLAMQAISFAVAASALAALITFAATPTLFALMGGKPPYLAPATAYMNVVLAGSAFFALSIVVNSILNTRGDTRSYRNAQIVAFVANIGLDWFFIFKLGMGVVGIAFATVLLQASVVIYLIWKASRLDFMRGATIAELLPNLSTYLAIARQSVPASLSMLLVAVGSLIIVAFVTPFGEPTVAAYGIALRIEQLVLLLVIGINIATLSLTGVNYGAGQVERVRESYRVGLQYAVGLMVTGGALIFLLAPWLMQLFTDDKEVQALGTTYLHFEAFILPAYALTFLSAAVLQGLKRPSIALMFNIMRQVVGQLLLFYLVVHVWKLNITGVWWSILAINWLAGVGIVWVVKQLLAELDAPAGQPRVLESSA